MAFDVCVCYGPEDAELGGAVTAACEHAGLRATLPGQGPAPDPKQLGVPGIDFGGARVAVVLVTRRWTAAGGLRGVMDLAERTGAKLLLAWWDEDAPSDFSGNRRPDESIFYACYLPRGEKLPALIGRIQAEVAKA